MGVTCLKIISNRRRYLRVGVVYISAGAMTQTVNYTARLAGVHDYVMFNFSRRPSVLWTATLDLDWTVIRPRTALW